MHGSIAYYAIGLACLVIAIMATKREWRWVWGVVILGACWLVALPHGF